MPWEQIMVASKSELTIPEQRLARGFISQCPLFKELGPERLKWLVAQLRFRQVKREEVVMTMGEQPDALGILCRGRLKAIAYSDSGREVGFSLINPVQHFGELALIDGQPRSASVVAVEASLIALLPRQQALELMINEPSVSARLMVALTQLVRRCNQQIMLLGYQHAQSRICALLLRSRTQEDEQGLEVLDFPSQREVATLTNTSRETVSRVLSQLQEAGVITREGRRIWLRAPERLERLIVEGRA